MTFWLIKPEIKRLLLSLPRLKRGISKILRKHPRFLFFALVGSAGLLLMALFLFLGNTGPEKSPSSNFNALDRSQYLSQEKALVSEIPATNIIEKNFLQSSAPPFLVSGKVLGALYEPLPQKEIQEYIVAGGDTLSGIALKFGISLETLLWANNLQLNSLIKPGQKLVILPVSGVLHVVREGDTLSEIAQIYKADLQEIVEFNELRDEQKIYAGDLLIIPGGKKPKIAQGYVQLPLSQSYFICPIPSPCKITQGLHWFNAVDFSNGKCGEPVFVAAGGKVQRTGYGRLSGYYIRILHPNGVVTFYGHLSKIIVKAEQRVYQGQIIAYIGHSGLTEPRGPSGCHLHFDVRFAKNPFAGYRVGTELGK